MRLKLYAIKNPSGWIAACPKSGRSLIAPYDAAGKFYLESRLKHIIEEYPEYNECEIIKLKEVWL